MYKTIHAIIFLVWFYFSGYAADRPNFIIILTDDQYVGLLGCEGNERIQTPHIDQLAGEGIQFTQAHVTSAICTPSRVSILLSQFERKHGVNFNSGTSVSEEAWEQSYPMVLRRNGYYTGYVGKNHAPIGEGGYESGVMEQAFDYWYAAHGHLSFYPKEHHEIFQGAKSTTQVEIIEEGAKDFLSNEHRLEGALKFLNERPADHPFCLSICFNLPHNAGVSSMELRDSDLEIYKSLYRNIEIPLPENYIAKADIKTPKLPADLLKAEERQTIYNYSDTPEDLRERIIRQMQAMTGIDQMLGQLREQLRNQGVDTNTILIFTSDHGLFMGQFGLGGKALCYETTTHVPLIIFNPKAPEQARNLQLNQLVQSIDIAPTLLDYAGIPIPETFQGISIKPLIEGQTQEVREFLYTENLWSTQFGNPRCEAVQNHDWKYIRYYVNSNFPASKKVETAKLLHLNVNNLLYATHDPDIALYRSFVEGSLQGEEPVYEELYHLKNDPEETTNLISDEKYQAIVQQLREAWKVSIHYARGTEPPRVLRYTKDSQLENKQYHTHE